jgi:hypothetical protein
MDTFNNREIAIAIWFVVILCFILFKREFRKSLLGLLITAFQTKILILIILMMFYTFWMVFVLYKISLWNIFLLKDTIIWFFFTGIAMTFDLVPSRENVNVFRKIIIDNIKIVIIIEFIANMYTFPLVVELFLIPSLTLIIGFEIVTKKDKRNESIAKLMSGLQIVIGLIILIYNVSKAVSDYKNFASLNTLRDFLLAPLLSFLFLPLVYIFLKFSKDKLLFRRIIWWFKEKLNFVKKKSNLEKEFLSYKEKATKGSPRTIAVFIAISDKNAKQAEVKRLCKEIVKKKRIPHVRIFIYDDIKYTPSSIPVPEQLDSHLLYLYVYSKNTCLEKLDKFQ